MKKTLMIGAAFSLLLGGAALADPAPSPADASSPAAGADAGPAVKTDFERGGPQGKWHHGRHGWDQRGGPGGPDGPRFGGWQRGGPQSKGPRIVLERFGSKIAVKCSDDDTTQQCVDAVKDLMGSIAQTMRHGPHGDHPGYRGPQNDGPQGGQGSPDGSDQ